MTELSILNLESDLTRKTQLGLPVRLGPELYGIAKTNKKWFVDWLRIHFGPGRLSADEFFFYGLHGSKVTHQQRKEYVGSLGRDRLHFTCNDKTWFAPCHNKLLFNSIMVGEKLSHPQLLAVYREGEKRTGAYQSIGSKLLLKNFLSDSSNFPCFAKPIEGVFSIGGMQLTDTDGSRVSIGQENEVDIDDLIEYMCSIDDHGYLFQHLEVPSSRLATLSGTTLPAVRFFVLNRETPEIHSATLKMPAGSENADNLWRDGNYVVPIDLETGKCSRGIATDQWLTNAEGQSNTYYKVVQQERMGALNSSEELDMPDWEAAKNLVLASSQLFPGIRSQGWDIAFTDAGPKVLELNFGGDVNLFQLAHHRGILDGTFCEHLRECGYQGQLPN